MRQVSITVTCNFEGCTRVAYLEDVDDPAPKGWSWDDYCPRHNNPYKAWSPPEPISTMNQIMQEIYKNLIISELAPKNTMFIVPKDFEQGLKTVTFPIKEK